MIRSPPYPCESQSRVGGRQTHPPFVGFFPAPRLAGASFASAASASSLGLRFRKATPLTAPDDLASVDGQRLGTAHLDLDVTVRQAEDEGALLGAGEGGHLRVVTDFAAVLFDGELPIDEVVAGQGFRHGVPPGVRFG